jgi:hypothetical protein
MLETIKLATAGLVFYKGFKILGKKDYADLIGFVSLLSVGFSIYLKIGEWYNAFMNSSLVQLIEKITEVM